MSHQFLNGKAVLITGAGGGIGSACARLAAQHGANLCLIDIDSAAIEALAADLNNVTTVSTFAADASQWADADRAVERCVSEFGAIDGLVNCAGRYAMADATDHDEALFRSIIETNLIGVGAYGTAALRRMRAQGQGSIVNVSSGAYLGLPSMAAYAASKGGVVSLTYAWAADFTGTNIRINAILPRAATLMTEVLWNFRGDSVAARQTQRAAMPTPEANAAAVIYLLSDAAAALSGQVIRVDGDKISLVTHPEVLPAAKAVGTVWTVAEVAAAISADGGIAGDLQPIGIVNRQQA